MEGVLCMLSLFLFGGVWIPRRLPTAVMRFARAQTKVCSWTNEGLLVDKGSLVVERLPVGIRRRLTTAVMRFARAQTKICSWTNEGLLVNNQMFRSWSNVCL